MLNLIKPIIFSLLTEITQNSARKISIFRFKSDCLIPVKNLLAFTEQSYFFMRQGTRTESSNAGGENTLRTMYIPDQIIKIVVHPVCKKVLSVGNCDKLNLCMINFTSEILTLISRDFQSIGNGDFEVYARVQPSVLQKGAINTFRDYKVSVLLSSVGSAWDLGTINFTLAGLVTTNSVFVCKHGGFGANLLMNKVVVKSGDTVTCRLQCVGYISEGLKKLSPVPCLPTQFERPEIYLEESRSLLFKGDVPEDKKMSLSQNKENGYFDSEFRMHTEGGADNKDYQKDSMLLITFHAGYSTEIKRLRLSVRINKQSESDFAGSEILGSKVNIIEYDNPVDWSAYLTTFFVVLFVVAVVIIFVFKQNIE